MRSDMGWFLWFWRLGPLYFGMDLTTWGAGFIFNIRYPRGFAAHLGPFYLTLEGSDLCDWTGNSLEKFGNFVARQLDRFDAWVAKRRRGRRGK